MPMMSPFNKLHSLPRVFWSTILKAAVVLLIIFTILHLHPVKIDIQKYTYQTILTPSTTSNTTDVTEEIHGQKQSIEGLVKQALQKHRNFIRGQSKTPEEAVENYKIRYSRNPPAGFVDWARYALEQNSTVIDNFDTIEKIMKPFRKLSPAQLQSRIEAAQKRGSRMQTVSISNGTFSVGGLPLTDSLAPVISNLPDLKFLLNELDEPRVLGTDTESDEISFQNFGRQPTWDRLTAACEASENQDTNSHYLTSTPDSMDLCKNPSYSDKYGMFTSPCTFLATQELVPVFSVARFSTMRDVLVPGHDYYGEGFLTKDDVDDKEFKTKANKLYWRGSNTGTYAGSNMNWETNHRARFMLKVRNNTDLFDVGMTAYIQCDWSVCNDMEQTLGKPPRAGKKDSFEYKFVMDLDGNGYSGRFYRLMLSNSVVFKQTLVEQWHDDRLFPWMHYVPVSISLDEIEELVTFFGGKGAALAETIAAESTEWVKAALRPVDMTIYEYRLLLEYADLFREKA